jgi:hypothetical protein
VVLINETPRQQGDVYVTAYENNASLGSTEYVFPELQATLTIFNFGLRNIIAIANGQRKIIEPNDSENFKHVNSVFLEALQGSQRFRLEGRKQVEQLVAGTVDSVAREAANQAAQAQVGFSQALESLSDKNAEYIFKTSQITGDGVVDDSDKFINMLQVQSSGTQT